MTENKIVVVGAGFSGLACAYYLKKAGHNIEIFEKSSSPGGLIQTFNLKYGLAETAANGLINSVTFEKMAGDIGVQIVATKKESRKRFIFRQRPRRWPLTLAESLRLLFGYLFLDKKTKPQETVSQWGARVFGRASVPYLLAPALQGIYAGDVNHLSSSLILGRFFNEKKKKVIKPKLKGSVSPRAGMADLLGTLRRYLEGQDCKFRWNKNFTLADLGVGKVRPKVVICGSPLDGAQILKTEFPHVATILERMEVLPLVTVTAFFPRSPGELQGFGCLFAPDQNFSSLGVLMNDDIFENRSSVRSETWILGGALNGDVITLENEELLKTILADRARLNGVSPEPLEYRIQRWPKAIPHYTVEHEALLRELRPHLKSLEAQGIYVVGNYLGSLGLSQILERASHLPKEIF